MNGQVLLAGTELRFLQDQGFHLDSTANLQDTLWRRARAARLEREKRAAAQLPMSTKEVRIRRVSSVLLTDQTNLHLSKLDRSWSRIL